MAPDDGRFGRKRFDVDLPLRAAAFAWDGRLLWAVGSELTASPVDDYRWEDLHGGRYAGLDPANGRMVVSRRPARRGGVGQRWGGGGDGRRPALRGGEDRAPAPSG